MLRNEIVMFLFSVDIRSFEVTFRCE